VAVVSLRVPGRIEYRELAIRAIAVACKVETESARTLDGRQREELANQLVSAIGEAFNNAVLHAYAGRVPGEVEIVATFDSERIVVDVVDFGSSFAPDQVPTPDLGTLPTSGMGFFIIRSFVDRLEYLPGRPNILRLTKILLRERPSSKLSSGR